MVWLLFLLEPSGGLSSDQFLNQIWEEYHKGNYQWVETKVSAHLEEKKFQIQDDKILILYVLSSSSLPSVELSLDRVYIQKKNHSPHFYTAVCYFLERALVLEEWKWMEKWGFRFRKYGSLSPKYAQGLYYYAAMFSETGRPQKANFLLNLALQANPSPSLLKKIMILKESLRESQ